MESFVVKKLGGENAAEMFESARNVIDDAKSWVQQAVIVSAMRSSEFNTTDELIKIWNALSQNDFSTVNNLIQAIWDFHRNLIKEKVGDLKEVYEEADRILEEELRRFLSILFYASNQKQKPSKENDYTIQDKIWNSISIIGFWEVLSAKIFSTVVNELSKIESQEILSAVIDTSNAVWEIIWWNAFMTLADNLSKKVNSESSISIVPGYVGGFKWGIESAVGRGYSDATAAALAVGTKNAGVDNVTLEIQKSVRGMLSADPRILDNPEDAKLIKHVDYILAKEIIGWAKAKLLHDQALRQEVIDNWIEIKLFDPFNEKHEWTIVWKEKNKQKWIHFIGWKEAVFFSVSSTNMWWPWILFTIFDVVKKYASVDIHTGSETEVSFSIEAGSAKNLQKIQRELQKAFWIKKNWEENFVKYEKKKATLHCVWNLKWSIGLSRKVTQILEDNGINIEMSSQWTQERAMIFGIDLKDMRKAVNALHIYFIK
jgi:aspartate kinase